MDTLASTLRVGADGPSSALAEEWEALAERCAASPFLRAGWITAWWRAFGRGALELHLVRDPRAGRLRALAPMARRGAHLASPTNWHTPAFGLLAEDEHARAALLAALLGARARRVTLAFLSSEDAARVSEAATRAGRRVLRRTLQRSPHVPLAGDFEAYLAARGKNLRADLRRRERKLAALGTVAFEVADGGRNLPELDATLAEGFALEAAAWKGARGSAMRSDPRVARFYVEVARWAAARGWLRLAFLRLDGRALAFDYALEHGGQHAMLKTGYDPAHAALSPGKLLRARMLQRAFALGLESYELLGADEPWKLSWTAATRARELVQAFRPSALGTLDYTLFAYGRPLARGLREHVRAAARARSARP